MLEEVMATLDCAYQTRRPETNDTPRLRVLAHQKHKAPRIRPGQEELFRSLWVDNIPIVVEEVTERMDCTWLPEDFVKSHGHERVKMIKMLEPDPVTISTTVAEFFCGPFREANIEGHAVKVKVVFALASCKKSSTDVGTSVAGLATDDFF